MSKNFNLAHGFTAKWEGGLSRNPKDPGGITNYGVSMRWLKHLGYDVNHDGVIDQQDIIDLTPGQAAELFRKHFWTAQKLDDMPALVAVCHYDASVNMGSGQAVKLLQRACNAQPGPPLVVDGGLGPRTRERVTGLCNCPAAALSLAGRMAYQRESFYRALVVEKPNLGEFFPGWINRTIALWRYVQGLRGV